MKDTDSNESCEGSQVPSTTEPNTPSKPKKSSSLDSPKRVKAANNNNCPKVPVDDGKPDGEKESERRKEEEEKDERKAETATESSPLGNCTGQNNGDVLALQQTRRKFHDSKQPAGSPGVL